MQFTRRSVLALAASAVGAHAPPAWPAEAARTSLLALGCKGDGKTDDREAFLEAVARGIPLTGEGRWYGIAGNARFSSAIDLEDAGFVALTPGPKTRVLFKTGPAPVRLVRVKVNRNGTEGSVRDAAAVRLDGADGVDLEDCEAFGGGPGTGFYLFGCKQVRHRRTYVHTMQWHEATDPGHGGERLQGIVHQHCNDIELRDIRIVDLIGGIGSSPPWAYQSDGLDFGNCTNFKVLGGYVENVSEAIDCSGGYGIGQNQNFVIDGFQTYRTGAAGIKITATARNGIVRNTKHVEPGFIGCAVASSASDIVFDHNQVISPGKNRNPYWSRAIAVAYFIGPGQHPHLGDITFIDCDGIDDSGSMKYYMRNKGVIPVTRIGGKAEGYTVAETIGPVRTVEHR